MLPWSKAVICQSYDYVVSKPSFCWKGEKFLWSRETALSRSNATNRVCKITALFLSTEDYSKLFPIFDMIVNGEIDLFQTVKNSIIRGRLGFSKNWFEKESSIQCSFYEKCKKMILILLDNYCFVFIDHRVLLSKSIYVILNQFWYDKNSKFF